MTLYFSILFGSLVIYIGFTLLFATGLLRLKSDRPPKDYSPNSSVAVIVAARNEERTLPLLLDDLLQQDYPCDLLEIIIADDRSSDQTWSIIEEYAQAHAHISGVKIDQVPASIAPKKNALSQALAACDSDLIVSTDADCRVPTTWVSSMVYSLEAEKMGISAGFSAIDIANPTAFNRYQHLDFMAIAAANAGALGWKLSWSGTGQNIAYRRTAFEAVNGFEPVQSTVSGDDMYLMQTIGKRMGAVFNLSPDSHVTTQPVQSIRHFLQQHIRWSSNSRKAMKMDRFFLFFLIIAFLCNTSLLVSVFLPKTWFIIPMAFGIKFVFDAGVIAIGAVRLKQPFFPFTYLGWALFQPLYIPLVGVAGLLGKFHWK